MEIVGIAVTGAISCVTDIRRRRIPNVVTAGSTVAALSYAGLAHGGGGILAAGEGCLIGLLLFLPFFLLRGMGAGDVKLLAALGAWLGPVDICYAAMYAALAGGALALVVAVVRGCFEETFTNIWFLAAHWRVNGLRTCPEVALDSGRGVRLAYAVPIVTGAAARLWLR